MTAYAIRLANGEDSAERMRRADALALFADGAGMARQGLRPDGGGSVAVVPGSMTVAVGAFSAWVDGGVSDAQGGYSFVSDEQVNLSVDPGHASLLRVDTVVAEVRDNTYDASGFTDARVRIVQGTPGAGAPTLPSSCLPLRNINVPAGASAGTGGLSSGDIGTDRRVYTTGLGGILPVASQSERDAAGVQDGAVVYRTDTDTLQLAKPSGWADLAEVPTEDTWHTVGTGGQPAYQNTWAATFSESLRFRKDTAGNLHIQGAVTAGTTATAMFTLPTGYRPTRNARATCISNTAAMQVRVATDGQVIPDTAVGAGYLLVNIVCSLA